MKSLKTITLIIMLMLASMTIQAQSTPEAVVGNVPSLPTPQQWAAGDTETFQAKLAELQGKLSEQTINLIPNVTQKDYEEHLAYQQRQQEQLNQELKQGFGFDINDVGNMTEAELEAKIRAGMQTQKATAMAELEKQMVVLASLGITEADLKKMENMNDKQSEAFIKKRLAENGYTEADLGQRMLEAGGQVMSDAEWKEEERRQQQMQAEGEAMMRAQETLNAYVEQNEIKGKLMDEAKLIAHQKLEALTEKYTPVIDKAFSEALECLDQHIGPCDYESRYKKYASLVTEYRTEAYMIWTEYILDAQGHLKILLTYASAADEATRNRPNLMGNAAVDQLTKMSNYAINVAAIYLNVTGSEPEVQYQPQSGEVEIFDVPSGGGKG